MASDMITQRLVAEFRATFGDRLFALPGDAAPLGIHWCLAPPIAATAALGPDGHPPRQHDVSVADFPRRMWVGGHLDLLRLPKIGEVIERTTTLAPIEVKRGGSGTWCLTGADHEFATGAESLIREHQDIAFRPAATAPAPPPAPVPLPASDMLWQLPTPDTLLFRYSALTFNGHRIHYDHPYATGVEGYAGLVVHGPLQATVLLNLAATLLGRMPARFAYRATAPLIAGTDMLAIGRRDGDGAAVSMHTPQGVTTMQATAE